LGQKPQGVMLYNERKMTATIAEYPSSKRITWFYWLKLLIASISIILVSTDISAVVKHIGIPVIQNYHRSEYNAATQNWAVEQGENGVMYFGNGYGMLRFDGKFWCLYGVPNGSNFREIYYSKTDERIYIGAYNDFGYFENDSVGELRYISLKQLLPESDRSFGDVWRIFEGTWGIAFQSFEGIFFYKDQQITVIKPRSIFHFSYMVNGALYVFDREAGLLEYRNGFLKRIPNGEFFAGTEVWSILPLDADQLLIGTARNGLYKYDGISIEPWNTPVNIFLKQYQIFSSVVIDENHFAFGTIQNGLVICDKQGNVVQLINREKGLQNNTVLSMSLDVDGNLWLGLDNGIDYIELNSPVTVLQDYYGFGTGYTSVLHNGNLYLGTNQGLFVCNEKRFKSPMLSASDFTMVANTSGQVWSLQVVGEKLFCGHNNGLFQIKGNIGIQISTIPGGWALHKLPGHPDLYLQGTYNGIELFQFVNGTLNPVHTLKGINYSCLEMVCEPNGLVWVTHAFKGVSLYMISANLDSMQLVKNFDTRDGLPYEHHIKIAALGSDTRLFITDDGLYQFNPSNMTFSKSARYNTLFENRTIQFIQQDSNKNIWFITQSNEAGVLRLQEDGTYKLVAYPFHKLKGKFIGSFFHFNIVDEENVMIAIERGFAHYNPSMVIDYRRMYKAVLTSVSLLDKGTLLYAGIPVGGDASMPVVHPKIDYRDNALRFNFSALFFEGNNETHFSYFLEGFDSDWSDWQASPTKEYTNLPDGDYAFKVRTRNKYGVIATPQSFVFTILPPWFKTTGAIIGYFILLILLVWIIIFLFVKRVERLRIKEKIIQQEKFREREEQLKREALEAEKEIIRLRNEKLHAEMIHKDKELANTAINLVQKNKQFNKIKADLRKIHLELKEELMRNRISAIVRKIDKETSSDEHWTIFETNFEQVHEEFLKRLKEKHPDITPKELKLAAYLRMNISTKEIATLMNITSRGVEISRYRLRKKLNIDRQTNLIDYVLSI
jgi:ligand-binding sensor domain-containing protein/DNA-binding CsgD family transcriptional regulator